MADLVFPRLIYRGAPDLLGQGVHVDPTTGELVGETKACNSEDEWEAAQEAGWRLTSALEAPKTAAKAAAKEKK